jgi:hypothetical protein
MDVSIPGAFMFCEGPRAVGKQQLSNRTIATCQQPSWCNTYLSLYQWCMSGQQVTEDYQLGLKLPGSWLSLLQQLVDSSTRQLHAPGLAALCSASMPYRALAVFCYLVNNS